MKKPIKVIKRKPESEPASETAVPVIVPPKREIDTDRDITNTIKGWISDRDKNSDAEKFFSAQQVVAWELL